MNAKRLLKLADLLESLAPARFDYSEWVGRDWKGAPDLSCGTTACALGWATTMGIGLKMVRTEYGGYVAYETGSDEGVYAAARAFDIHPEDAKYLFIPLYWRSDGEKRAPSDHASARAVARHIRDFVAWKQEQP